MIGARKVGAVHNQVRKLRLKQARNTTLVFNGGYFVAQRISKANICAAGIGGCTDLSIDSAR